MPWGVELHGRLQNVGVVISTGLPWQAVLPLSWYVHLHFSLLDLHADVWRQHF